MKHVSIFLLAILLGFALFVAVSFLLSEKPQKIALSPLAKTATFSVVEAPRESLRGTMKVVSGDVKLESRTATEAATITAPTPIQQGERLIIGDTGQVSVQFPNATELTLSPHTDVTFAQTLPQSLVINQKTGIVTYKRTGTIPLAIRSLHLLLEPTISSLRVGVDDESSTITIKVLEGSVTGAFNDIDNLSTLITIHAGETYLFDDEKRQGSVQ